MAEPRRYADEDGGFDVRIPEGWTAEPEPEEGGVELSRPDGAGVLHLIGFSQDQEPPDPAEELYAFLEDQEVELEEDEVEDMELEEGELAYTELVIEDEEDPESEPDFWLVGVAVLPGSLVFATYSCAAGDEEQEVESVRTILRSLRPCPRID